MAVPADDFIRLVSDTSMDELERIDPYRKFAEASQSTEASAAFVIPEEVYPPEDDRCTCYEISCPIKDFLAVAKAQNTSVAAFLSLTAARAISSLYDVGEMPIVVMVPADMRKYYHTSTIVNFSDAIFLRYDEELKALPSEDQGAALTEQLKSQMTKEHFASLISEKVSAIDGFASSDIDIFQWNELLAKPSERPAPFTIPITYTGRLDLPVEYQSLVSGITNRLYFRGAGIFGILCVTYGDTVHISSCQRFESPAIMLELQKMLNGAGIPASFQALDPYRGNQLVTKRLQKI